ncbi:hypothetical protein FHG87_017012 [Trinorchestia longiramus]|nr:hypothetical protein FHG87_017012 [Trinorchestia longiramus]
MDDVTKSLNVTLAHTLADAHCFLHAVALPLNETPNTMQEIKTTTKILSTRRVVDLIFWYTNTSIIKYSIMQPGSSSRKLLPMLYKNRSISMYSERDGGIWKTVVQPTMLRNINKSYLLVHLKDYHYSALIKEKNASINKISASR